MDADLAPPASDGVTSGRRRPAVHSSAHAGRSGELEVMDRGPVATSYALSDETFTVRLHSRLDLAAYLPDALEHRPRRTRHDASRRDGGYTLTFPMVASRWGYDDLNLPRAHVRRDACAPSRRPAARTSPVVPSADFLDHLPAEESRQRFRGLVEVMALRPPVLTLNVQEPLADDVRGQRNQYRLWTAARVEEATQDSVFFRALYSEVANCNMLGVHHELGRRGTQLTRYWSVRDHSVPVPEGGVG